MLNREVPFIVHGDNTYQVIVVDSAERQAQRLDCVTTEDYLYN